MFDSVGVPVLEMRCPNCKQTQTVKVRSTDPGLTKCLHCKVFLVYVPEIVTKPNAIKMTLNFYQVPIEVSVSQAGQEAIARETMIHLQKQAS